MAWPVLPWPGQNGTFVLKSTGCFEQVELSPCIAFPPSTSFSNCCRTHEQSPWGKHCQNKSTRQARRQACKVVRCRCRWACPRRKPPPQYRSAERVERECGRGPPSSFLKLLGKEGTTDVRCDVQGRSAHFETRLCPRPQCPRHDLSLISIGCTRCTHFIVLKT